MAAYLWPLVLLGALALLVAGLYFLSEATLGVGLIGAAGVLAILARLAQAADHHKEQMNLLLEINEQLVEQAELAEEYEKA